MMDPRRKHAVQNICNIKIMKLANIWEEKEVFVKNWEGSILQSVAMTTVKTIWNALYLWPLTAHKVSLNFFYISGLIRQSTHSCNCDVISPSFAYQDGILHITSFLTLNANILRTRSDIEKPPAAFFLLLHVQCIRSFIQDQCVFG